MLKPDAEWIRDREDLLTHVRGEVVKRLGPETEDLRKFRRRYERELANSWTISSKSELMNAVEQADIVYGGDFHASSQAQRTHLRILRAISNERPIVLALECFALTSQKWLDLYLKGELSTDELRKRVKWQKSWGFPWDHYRPLVEIAKRRGFGLVGLNDWPQANSHSDLSRRERSAAVRIREVWRQQPTALIYVVIGDLHTARQHLPREVRSVLKVKSRMREVVVQLNSERVYFGLSRKGLELTVEVVRFGAQHAFAQRSLAQHALYQRFCVMSSPPWVPWQNYLLYLERTQDENQRGRALDSSESFEHDAYDPTDQVASLVRLVARDLKIDLARHSAPVDARGEPVETNVKVNDLAVYSIDDNRVWQALERHTKPSERQAARQLLAAGKSFFLPASGTGFLAQPTINHAATIAGQYLHALLSGRKRTLWRMPNDLSRLIWVEAVAYFISKLINHQRRAHTAADLKAELALLADGNVSGVEAMKLAVDRLVAELILVNQGRRRISRFRPRRKSSYYEAARILGGMLGDKLYIAHRSHKLKSQEIVQLLHRDVTHKTFEQDYESILRRLQSVRVSAHAKSRRERL